MNIIGFINVLTLFDIARGQFKRVVHCVTIGHTIRHVLIHVEQGGWLQLIFSNGL